MRKILTFLFAALMSVGMWAAPSVVNGVQIGDLYYNLRNDNKTAEVTYEENQSQTNYSGLTSVDIPSSVTYENQTFTVTSIGVDAFWGCAGLTNITIPSSVTSIEDGAFTACKGLTSVTIPSSVTSIGADAFYSSTNIADVNCYPNAANLTWNEGDCDDFKSGKATICHVNSDQLDAYQTKFNNVVNVTFEGDLDAPAPAAPAWLLAGDEWDETTKTLTVNSNPDSYAYYGEFDIENLVISDAVTSIGAAAFMDCHGLTSVTIGNNVESIAEQAFCTCIGLTSITIPNNVASIGMAAFGGCASLTSIVVASGNTKYDSRDNCNAIIEKSTNTLIAGCKSTIIPSSVTSIGAGAFFGCTGLTSITIPNSVASIGEYAFYWCSGLQSIYINATTPPTLGSAAFEGTAEGLKIYVPAEESVVADYKAAENWSAYADKIEAIPDPAPQGEEIIPNVDPENPTVYYSTFYDSAKKYELPEGVEAYVATIGENVLNLTKIAEAGQVIPNDNAVILKSSVTPFTLTLSEADAVTFSANNDLQGTDEEKDTPANCYVLSGEDGVVGFYQYNGTKLNPHKAYVLFSGSNAPRRMRFVFDAATGVENVQGNVQSTKVLRDGQLIIIRNGVEYNANGMMVK